MVSERRENSVPKQDNGQFARRIERARRAGEECTPYTTSRPEDVSRCYGMNWPLPQPMGNTAANG
jgi:hypothetical protein